MTGRVAAAAWLIFLKNSGGADMNIMDVSLGRYRFTVSSAALESCDMGLKNDAFVLEQDTVFIENGCFA